MEELWFMPAGEEIDMSGTFDFVRLNIKAQKTIRARTMAMVRVIGDNDDRKVALFRRLLRTMTSETGKPGKALQTRFDACKLCVHCLYEIALNDAADGKMVFHTMSSTNSRLISNDACSSSHCLPDRLPPCSPLIKSQIWSLI
jgi:hypothetical protein